MLDPILHGAGAGSTTKGLPGPPQEHTGAVLGYLWIASGRLGAQAGSGCLLRALPNSFLGKRSLAHYA